MDNRLSVKDFLRVFELVRSNGDIHDQKYKLGDIYAWHDYDGYTCWLGYKDVTVTLMFHGSLKIDYGNPSNYSEFIRFCLELTANKSKQ